MDSAKIVNQILRMQRRGDMVDSIIQHVGLMLVEELTASRCVVWQIIGEELRVTNELTVNESACFLGNYLNSRESMSLVLEFLSRFPDESGSGVIVTNNLASEPMPVTTTKYLSLLDLGNVRARLLGQLRASGCFRGFVEIQQTTARDWTDEEISAFEDITIALSVVVQIDFERQRLQFDAEEARVINQIMQIFNKERSAKAAWSQASLLAAQHLGFRQVQLYLIDHNCKELVAQLDGESKVLLPGISIDLDGNPVIEVFRTSQPQLLNFHLYSRREPSNTDYPLFGIGKAALFPLASAGEALGVICFWQQISEVDPIPLQVRTQGLSQAGLFGAYAQRLMDHAESSAIREE